MTPTALDSALCAGLLAVWNLEQRVRQPPDDREQIGWRSSQHAGYVHLQAADAYFVDRWCCDKGFDGKSTSMPGDFAS